MNSKFIEKEVDEIVNNKSFPFPENFAMCAAWIIANFKGINLKILDVRGMTHLADYFVLASATNPVQGKSMATELEAQFKRKNMLLTSKEGLDNAEWILYDFGDIIVHIFQDSVRDIFDMDSLWKDAPRVKIPAHYYQTTAIGSKSSDDDSGNFW